MTRLTVSFRKEVGFTEPAELKADNRALEHVKAFNPFTEPSSDARQLQRCHRLMLRLRTAKTASRPMTQREARFPSGSFAFMCNLYSITKGPQAIRDFARAVRDTTGNLPPLPGVFPDFFAPIVRNGPDGVRELVMARWGMPSPMSAINGRNSDPGVTNVRNVSSPHWRRWLGVESRCVVPFNSFAENELLPNGSRPPVWFALDDRRPLAFFAGIWTRWTSV